MSSLCRFRQGERYGACDDVQGLGKATPQQDSAQDKMSILAKFGPAVESCSKTSATSVFSYIFLSKAISFCVFSKYLCS